MLHWNKLLLKKMYTTSVTGSTSLNTLTYEKDVYFGWKEN